MNKRSISFAVLLCASLATLFLMIWRPLEPEHKGKKLGFWLESLSSFEMPERETAQEAFRTLSKSAVPFLVYTIERKQPQWEVACSNLCSRIGWKLPGFLATPNNFEDRKYRAAIAFTYIGSSASNAIPRIISVMDNNPNLRCNLVYALGAIAPGSRFELEAIEALKRITGERTWEARHNAYEQLGKFKNNAAYVMPILIRGMSDSNFEARAGAFKGLAALGTFAHQAIPHLEELLNSRFPQGDRKLIKDAFLSIGGTL